MVTNSEKTPRPRPQHPLKKSPEIIQRKGSWAQVRIYAEWNTSRRLDEKTGEYEEYDLPAFRLVYKDGTERIRKKFSDLKQARHAAQLVLDRLIRGEVDLAGMDPKSARDFMDIKDEMVKRGYEGNIRTIFNDYMRAMELLPKGTTLMDAVQDFARRNRNLNKRILISELKDEFIAEKQKVGVSDEYLKTLKRLRKFAEEFPIYIDELDVDELEDFIRGLGSPRTQLNYYRLVRVLCGYAVKKRYVSGDLLDELKSIELTKLERKEKDFYTPDELQEMLDAAPDKVMPYIIIAGFTGMRNAEIKRLSWDDFILISDAPIVQVRASNAKTGSRRTIPLCEYAAKRLKEYKECNSTIWPYESDGKLREAIIAAVNRKRSENQNYQKFRWKRNGFRDSFISYRMMLVKSIDQVALEAGNSPNMIREYYHHLVEESDSNEWFQIQI